jgi:excisionase family DNA binding protein
MRDQLPHHPRGSRGAPRAASCAPLLTVQAVADLLDVSSKTVRRLIARGDLAAHRIGGSLRVSEGDLRVYLGRCR